MRDPILENQIDQDQSIRLVRRQLYTLAILVIITFISYLPLLVGKIALVDTGISQNDLMFFLVLPFLSYFLMLICPVIANRIIPALISYDLAWFQKKRSEILWSFLLLVILIISAAVTRLLVKQLGMHFTSGTLLLTTNTAFLVVYSFRMAIVGSVVEEIFWRGFIQDRLEKVFGPWIALFTQAIAFAALHFRPIGSFFWVFVIGLILGLWRCKRKTLLPIIFAHIIINSLWCINFWYNQNELAKVKHKTDYVSQFNEISKPTNYDPNNNAANYYKNAFGLVVERPAKLSKLDIKAWPKDLPEEKQVLLENWLSANSDAIKQLKFGTQKPYYWAEYHGNSMWDISLPDLKQSRSLTCAICLRAKNSATKGHFKEAFSDLLTGYKFGKHLSGTKTLIEQLVGIAIERLLAEAGLQIIDNAKGKLSPEALKHFQENLQSLSSEKSFIDLSGEKFAFHEGIQMTFTDDGKGDGYVPQISVEQMADPPPYLRALSMEGISDDQKKSWAKLRRQETAEHTDNVFEYLNSVIHKTPAQLDNEGINLQKAIAEMTNANPLILLLMPAIDRCLQISHRSMAETNGLITTLALLRYKADKGIFPNTLQELVSSKYIERLPMDPYSNASMVYKRTGDDFTLYSLGADFDDDGGKPSIWGEGEQGGDQVFWPVQK